MNYNIAFKFKVERHSVLTIFTNIGTMNVEIKYCDTNKLLVCVFFAVTIYNIVSKGEHPYIPCYLLFYSSYPVYGHRTFTTALQSALSTASFPRSN